jgi:hypothetical protein
MPGETGVTVVTTLVCSFNSHTRLRAHRAPGIPCALDWEGAYRQNSRDMRGEIAKSCTQSSPLPPRAFARGGEGSGVGGLSARSSGSEFAEAPPTPDPSPPLRGGRGSAGRLCEAERKRRGNPLLLVVAVDCFAYARNDVLFGSGCLKTGIGVHANTLGQCRDCKRSALGL